MGDAEPKRFRVCRLLARYDGVNIHFVSKLAGYKFAAIFGVLVASYARNGWKR